jgi:UDP-2,3-diacylglucosamine hydrolase
VSEGLVVFASDAHLDHEVPDRIERFERFLFKILPALGCRKLFLLGDIFNIWYIDPRLAERYGDRILELLSLYIEEGGELEFVVGNRDFALCYDRLLAAPFAMRAGPIRRRIGGKSFYLCHGDDLLRKDYGYRLLHGAIRRDLPMACFHALGTGAKERIVSTLINLSHEAKKRKKRWRTQPDRPYLRALVEAGTDVIVQGHKHDRTYHEIRAAGRTGRHFVLPRWFDQACGLAYDPTTDRFSFFDFD